LSLDLCRWPALDEPYHTALREAVTFILDRFDPLGIVTSGTILRGNPGPSSDLDLYVIHALPQRQRLQRWFNGVPAEIFVNPPGQVEHYFEEERREARPISAHILATGFVILNCDPVIDVLRERARVVLRLPPDPTPEHLLWMRYMLATQVEDALDIAADDLPGAILILSLAVHGMLRYAFWQANRHLPRDKDLLTALADLDPALAALGRAFYTDIDSTTRLDAALQIADRTIQTRGFFEWESEPEAV
jgi:predicted nucleotidyltransferase